MSYLVGNDLQNSSGAVIIVIAAFALFSTKVFAAGTPAGTAISNQANAAYRANNGQQMPPVASNVVVVVVQQVGAVNITPVTASRSTQINTLVDYPSTVTNSGNGVDNLLLTASSSLGFTVAMYRDANGNSVLDPGELAAGPVTQTGNLPADSTERIITRVTVPNNISLNGQTDILTVTATSAYEPTANAAGTYTTTIASAAMTFTKSVNITAPRGGDRVMYTIAYTNSGGSPATNVTVTDVLDGNLNYVTSSAVPVPSGVTGQTITWNLGAVAPSGSGSITFQADVVNNATPGIEIHNVAQVAYNDGVNLVNITSIENNFITVQSGGVVTVDFGPNRTGSGEAGDTLDYAFTVTNNGSLSETFTLSYVSNQNLVWTYYQDVNSNGQIDPGDAQTTSTGLLASGGQYNVVARTILAVAPANGTVDATTFRAASTTNPSNFETTTGTTTLYIPVMSLVKIADSPVPKPGREIRYQITYSNSGDGHALEFAVTDSIPPNTTYIPSSVKLNNVSKTDAADGDEVTVSGNLITVNVGTINPLASGFIEFRVLIN